jgi:hypothetical protein
MHRRPKGPDSPDQLAELEQRTSTVEQSERGSVKEDRRLEHGENSNCEKELIAQVFLQTGVSCLSEQNPSHQQATVINIEFCDPSAMLTTKSKRLMT